MIDFEVTCMFPYIQETCRFFRRLLLTRPQHVALLSHNESCGKDAFVVINL